ncbi:MAG: DNA gyrase subunit B, partial [Myxococcales bacterium]|nr:DNA gyrase subunit B [Myxococcales bacterium]
AREDFKLEDARYHKIIIISDAHVGGAHIRTLLLTFFYRHFPELIEKGHVYIAQPPLYKVKAGKREVYLKDDHELDRHVIRNALDGISLQIGDHEVSSEVLSELARRGLRYRQIVEALAREHRAPVIEALLDRVEALGLSAVEERFEGRERLAELAASIVESVRKDMSEARVNFEVIADETDSALHQIRLLVVEDGVTHHERIDAELLGSPELAELLGIRRYVAERGGPPFVIRRSGEVIGQPTRLVDLVHSIGEIGRTGLQIQRYKGLGEMNPEQLWETTMDPDRRALLKVRVGDDLEADTVFSVLMGDNVEPRREFITQNALNARNLDV